MLIFAPLMTFKNRINFAQKCLNMYIVLSSLTLLSVLYGLFSVSLLGVKSEITVSIILNIV